MGRDARRKQQARAAKAGAAGDSKAAGADQPDQVRARVVEAVRLSDGTRTHYVLTGREERERAAYHEAAHVAVAWHLGIPVRRVSLDVSEAQALSANLIASTRRGFGTLEEAAVVSLVGYVFDRRWQAQKGLRFGFLGGGHHDATQAMCYALVARGVRADGASAGPEEHALIERWGQRADALLDRLAEDRERVGAALLKRGALEFVDLQTIIGPGTAISSETLSARRETYRAVVQLGYEEEGKWSEEEAVAADLVTLLGGAT